MLRRALRVPPEHLYPEDPWRIVETAYSEEHYARTETAFSLANGYLGLRGTFDEGAPAVAPGAFVNGFHETWRIVHAEEAYGLARTGQTMVTVPDASVLRLYVDDEPLFVPTARLAGYQRTLDLRAGTLERELIWSTPAGKHVSVRSQRLVSLEHRHLAAIAYEVKLLDHPAPLVLCSEVVNRQDAGLDAGPGQRRAVDPRRGARLAHRVLDAQVVESHGSRILLGYETANSRMTLAVGVDLDVDTSCGYERAVTVDGDRGEIVLTVEAEPGVSIRVVKLLTYHSSRSAPVRELVSRSVRTLDRAAREGFDALLASQRANLDRFWDRADVVVDVGSGPARTQQAIRWNLFQVAQATWRAEGSGVPAKGLTGAAYEGHYFWDTEIYVLPFLAYTWPRVARNVLRFRASMLESARARARDLGHRGATFAWRTINGEEASAYYQAGTAQYHLNADIAHAIRRYVQARGDVDFLAESGAAILVETARMWEDLGFYSPGGEFHIHGVTGPDEYTAVVNDNAYTNLMARENLRYAAEVARRLAHERPSAHAALCADTGLESWEIEAWERAAAAMHVPYDEALGIHPQDAHFLERELWDLAATPDDHFPLLLHYHPLEIYRRQVIKQADVVLAMFLAGDCFSEDQKRRNFDYYDALTTGDSSLSACVQSVIAAEVGHEEQALDYFRFALLMDLADAAGNASDGVHIASAAGVWQALVFGFGGVRDSGEELCFNPRLPTAWRSLAFSLRYRDRQLRVRLTHEADEYLLEEGSPLDLTIRGRRRHLSEGRIVRCGADERTSAAAGSAGAPA